MSIKRRVMTLTSVCIILTGLHVCYYMLSLRTRKDDFTQGLNTRDLNTNLNTNKIIQDSGLTNTYSDKHVVKRNVASKKKIIMYQLEGMEEFTTKTWDTFMSNCGCGNCQLIKYGSNITLTTAPLDADAIIFPGGIMSFKTIPKRRTEDQVFIFISLESAFYCMYTDLTKPLYTNFYNWTMTYRLDSDIPVPYGQIVPVTHNFSLWNRFCSHEKQMFVNISNGIHHFDGHLESKESKQDESKQDETPEKNYSAIFKMKSRSAVWLAQHCITPSIRELYILHMQNSMNVDVFGGCGNETSKNACPYNSKCENFIIENYKFFLAFENSLCDDYITEKAYQWFSKDIVLVVRGARKYHRYLPQGTYVDAEDFDHPWKLAVYLEQLAQNEEEYVRILKLKDQFKVVSHVEMMNAGFCELCRRLNDIESYRKSYKNIGAWWGGHCTVYL